MTKTIEELAMCTEKVAKAYGLAQSSDLQLTYDKLRVQLQDWAKVKKKETKCIYSMLPKHFRYSQLESRSYNELFSNRINLKERLEKMQSNLMAKKEKLFKDQAFAKWGVKEGDMSYLKSISNNKEQSFRVMLYKETGEVADL